LVPIKSAISGQFPYPCLNSKIFTFATLQKEGALLPHSINNQIAENPVCL